MRFGIVLPTYPEGATVEGVIRVAQAAERLGFTSAWTTDHVILPRDSAGPYKEIFEPLMMTAYVAAHTSTIQLGISVIVVPQRQGIVLAKQIATLDHLCQGRLIVGVGAGWNEQEFQMLERGSYFHRRGRYLDETLSVWRHLWTNPEVEFHGEFYDLPSVAFGPLPVQAGGPPVWVGGSSLNARRRSVRHGAAWHPVGPSAADLHDAFVPVQRFAEEQKMSIPEIVPRLPMHLGESSVGQMTAGRHHVLQGTPSAVAEQLFEYQQVGVSEIDCLFGSSDPEVVVEQMEQFSANVMPILASETSSPPRPQ